MFNDYFKFAISEHLLSALINGDYSSLNDDESESLDDFINEYSDYLGVFDVLDDEPNFRECDVTGLFSNCATVLLHFTNTTLVAA